MLDLAGTSRAASMTTACYFVLMVSALQPVESRQECSDDYECKYSGCSGDRRCCSYGYCVSGGSCSGGDAVFCPSSSGGYSSSSVSGYSSGSSSSSYPSSSTTNCQQNSQNSNCLASCNCPQTCMTCSKSTGKTLDASLGASGSSVGAGGSVSDALGVSFCCDQSSPENLQKCRAAAGCSLAHSILRKTKNYDRYVMLAILCVLAPTVFRYLSR
jgi:hypothetical protein